MPKTKQAKKNNKHKPPPPLTTEKIDHVCDQIEAGPITLPKVADGKILALMDSGAAPNIANLAKHFPGCTIRPSKQASTFYNANGKPFLNDGKFNVPCTTAEGQSWETAFQNADVALPIFSTGLLCDAEYEVVYRQNDGELRN